MSVTSFRRVLISVSAFFVFMGVMTHARPIASGLSATGDLNPQVEKRINDLISQMTLDEKISMLGGVDDMDTKPIPRLGIPAIKMNDGPLGVRVAERTTAFPAGIAMGASFNPSLVQDVARAIADETRTLGHNMLLGPCVNISRNPFGGRNFESFGEDPFLSSHLAVSYVRGIQGQNVLASVKHFALNEQEFERMSINVNADVRSMYEMHFPMFKAAIDAGSWTVMASYNKVNGHHASENDFLLNQVLKKRWGFKGFVVSDWGATHSVVEAANAGLDLEMPAGDHFGPLLLKAVKQGKVQVTVINDKVRRILRAMFVIGLIDPQFAPTVPPPLGPDSQEHHDIALKMARESAVLLKNDNKVLPLRLNALRSVAVIGPNANVLRTGGGGSSHVDATDAMSPLQALEERVGRTVSINYAMGARLPQDLDVIPGMYLRPGLNTDQQGLRGEYFNTMDLSGSPILTRVDETLDFGYEVLHARGLSENFSVRWTGYLMVPVSGHYNLSTNTDDGVRLFVDGKEIISNWTDHGTAVDTAEIDLEAGRPYAIRLEYYQHAGGMTMQFGWVPPGPNLLEAAVKTARNSDVAIVFAGMGFDESEGFDRGNMDLPEGQDALIKAVAAANPNTIVVLTGGNPVRMGEWINDVKGLMHVWYPGQEGSEAIVDLLTGAVNPSGKLPVTFIKRWEDSAAYGNYPGRNGQVNYKEGLFIGYRHADRANVTPQFPFGFGLSYTTFSYSDLDVKMLESSAKEPRVQVSFTVTNTGAVEGAEVAQLYVGEQRPTLARPPKELKGFRKINLMPGQAQRVTIELNGSAFAYFDVKSMSFKANAGRFNVLVGSSSRDLALAKEVRLTP